MRSSRRVNLSPDGTRKKASFLNGHPSLLLLVAILLVFCPLMARGQELSATLSGSVTDTSGAVIPHASITIVLNGVNGTARVVQSDGAGNYTAPNLTAGTYSITVVAPGFETFKGQDIVLDVAEKHAFNAQLKAGAVSTTVTVEDNPVSVDTETSGQAGTISGEQIRELEINSRNFEQLLTLQPGVVNQLGDEPNAGGIAMSVNGARLNANNWTVDGADINDSGSNATVVSQPSMEAIQEITLERGNYDAGYGRSGGGQILVATRNGTSAFHGEGYEYVRNTDFDANDWLNKQSQIAGGGKNTPGVYHQNVYGFVIGGPVYIPKVYNEDKKKTFFFWSEDWHKINQAGSSVVLTSPTTAAMTNGNWSAPSPGKDADGTLLPAFIPAGPAGCVTATVNPADNSATGTVNVGMAGCLSKNAQLYIKDVFGPNTNAAGSVTINLPAVNNYRDDIVRIDHYFNDKVHFYARGLNDIMPVTDPMGLWAGNNYQNMAAVTVDSPGKNVVANLTYAISPKIVNEFEFVYAQGTYFSQFQGNQFADNATAYAALQPNTQKYNDPYGRMPAVSITGVQGFSAGSTPWHERNLDRSYFDNLSLSYGKHTLRMGFEIQQMIKTENAVNGEASFSFQAPFSGGDAASFATANFLLGNSSVYSQASRDIIPDLNYYNTEAYLQDDWKLSQKLTLNLGVRWSALPSPSDTKNTLSNFDPNKYSPLLAPQIDANGNFVAGQSIGGYALVANTYANGLIFPQGAACTAAQAIAPQVQCSPYGKTINPNSNANFAPRVGFAYNPDGRGKTSIRGGFGAFYDRTLNGIFEQNAFWNPPLTQQATVNNGSFDNYTAGSLPGPDLSPNGGLGVTGTPTFKVPNYFDYNLTVEHQILPTTVLSVAYVGSEARHQLGEVDGNQPTLASRIAYPTANINAIRPYVGYGYFRAKEAAFTSNYNSLQIDLQHRSSKGLTLNLAYTYSKSLTTNSNDRGSATTDTYNPKMDYGPSSFNVPQMLILNYVYNLPFFKEQHGAEGLLLGGWEFSGITTMVAGTSFNVVQGGDPFAVGSNGGLGINNIDGDKAARPNQIAPVTMTKKPAQWFSTSSYTPAVGQFGNTHVGSLLGPGMDKWDMALAKTTKIGEHVAFQLRVEAFDVFNHPNFSGVDSNIGDAISTVNGVTTGFGTINGDHEPRILQMGGKITF
ncbi:MAG: TonB-dependent receptor [Terracidiphilus sp.]